MTLFRPLFTSRKIEAGVNIKKENINKSTPYAICFNQPITSFFNCTLEYFMQPL